MTKVFRPLALLAVATLTLAACNTVKGMGRDIQGAGQTVENVAGNTRSSGQQDGYNQ